VSNPYRTVYRASLALSIAVGALAANVFGKFIDETSKSPSWGLIADIVAVVLLAHILEKGATYLIDELPQFRSLIFHRYFIEGTWVDIALEGEEVKAIGLTGFELRDFQVQWHGENHDLQWRVYSKFRTFMSTVDWPEVRFWFKNDPEDSTSGILEGVAELHFELDSTGRPNHYSGWACGISHAGVSKVVGWKITKKKDLKELGQAKTRPQALKRIVAEYREFKLGRPVTKLKRPHTQETPAEENLPLGRVFLYSIHRDPSSRLSISHTQENRGTTTTQALNRREDLE